MLMLAQSEAVLGSLILTKTLSDTQQYTILSQIDIHVPFPDAALGGAVLTPPSVDWTC
jgi:hypothetical protein